VLAVTGNSSPERSAPRAQAFLNAYPTVKIHSPTKIFLDILFALEVMAYLSAEASIFWASGFETRLSGARKGVAWSAVQT
jgi:hypothetical protein